MPVPSYSLAIYTFLTSAGLSPNAAAGILGNIEQESGGNPESIGSGGGGLIGWTPLPHGLVTGNPAVDVSKQMDAIIAYIKGNGSIADINAHSPDPATAASYFMTKYERPRAGPTANEANRRQSASDVAAAAKSGNWPASAKLTASATGVSTASLTSATSIGIPGLDQITPFFSDATNFVNKIMWLLKPSNWLRIVAFIAGVALLLFAIHAFIAVGNGEPIIQMPSTIPVPV